MVVCEFVDSTTNCFVSVNWVRASANHLWMLGWTTKGHDTNEEPGVARPPRNRARVQRSKLFLLLVLSLPSCGKTTKS